VCVERKESAHLFLSEKEIVGEGSRAGTKSREKTQGGLKKESERDGLAKSAQPSL